MHVIVEVLRDHLYLRAVEADRAYSAALAAEYGPGAALARARYFWSHELAPAPRAAQHAKHVADSEWLELCRWMRSEGASAARWGSEPEPRGRGCPG